MFYTGKSGELIGVRILNTAYLFGVAYNLVREVVFLVKYQVFNHSLIKLLYFKHKFV